MSVLILFMLSNKLQLEWKRANISSIFKKGSKSELSNYRPVSFTAVLCEIVESIIKDKMLKFAQENIFMTSDKHGFMKSRFCLTNVLETLEDWTKALDSGYNFFDYQKAFDTVPHKDC